MKKIITRCLLVMLLFFSSCTKTINQNAKITVTDVPLHEKDSLSENIKEQVLDTLSYNQNIIISNDSKTAYVFEINDNKIDLVYKISCPAKSEEADWAIFFMVVIFLLILSL